MRRALFVQEIGLVIDSGYERCRRRPQPEPSAGHQPRMIRRQDSSHPPGLITRKHWKIQ